VRAEDDNAFEEKRDRETKTKEEEKRGLAGQRGGNTRPERIRKTIFLEIKEKKGVRKTFRQTR